MTLRTFCSYILFFILYFIFSPIKAQIGTWRAYMSYHEPQQIVKAGANDLFVRASNGLFQYNLKDQSIVTFDKVNNLNGTVISQIAWNQKAQRLVVAYDNSNIDLIDRNGHVTNVSAIYQKTMTQDKTINSIYNADVFAYISTGFGIVKLNVAEAYVNESYILNENIMKTAISGSQIYALKADGTCLTATLGNNLLDFHNWSETSSYPANLFDEDTNDWDTYLQTVQSLQPGGPMYNHFNYMRFMNNRLYTCGGGWKDGGSFARPFIAQILDDNDDWQFYDKGTMLNATRLRDATSLAIDPKDPEHIFISSCGAGFFEYQNGMFVKNYTDDNSPLESAIPGNHNYVRVDGLQFDSQRRLWMTCSSDDVTLLSYDLETDSWQVHDDASLTADGKRLNILRKSITDSRGYIYFFNDHHSHPCTIRLNPSDGSLTRYDTFINQDGTKYEVSYVRCGTVDKDGNIWIGTNLGLYMYDEAQLSDPSRGFTQIKVPRNDGSDYADYLMSGVDITAITIDGGNRKWIGTNGNGAYLLSADNMEQLLHFTAENSGLLSDKIESIAVNGKTGEVYFGTDQGLCSYMGDATEPVGEMEKDDVYAYPNPVEPGYTGLITVVGLAFDADVKILTANGKLVAQGRSNGGTFTWDGRDLHGKPVASGVYMVAVATSSGDSGVVSKIAIIR